MEGVALGVSAVPDVSSPQEWVRARVFMKLLKALAEDLRERGKIDLTEAFIDGTFAGAKRGALSSELLAVAPPQRSWQLQTVAVLQSRLGLRAVRELRSSSSKKRSANASSEVALAKRGIDMIAPHNPTHRKTQDARKLKRYRRRWLIERVFAWLMRFRRVVTRYEHKAENFLCFVELGCAVILLRRF